MSDSIQHFGLRPFNNEHHQGLFELMVDGQPYLVTLTDYESAFAGNIAGSYLPGLNVNNLNIDSTGAIPFICTCSEPSCWFIGVEIFIQADTEQEYVIWHQWCNPYRDDKSKAAEGLYWDYSGLPPLVFDKKQYEDEIARALSSP
ncbi:hypothetical protein QX776_09740 [Alteromonadaceae bacterium BrNp21-10]|nr:hypothetical protein [Alteromonadaceae bacterium BrNp21-10]